MPSNNAGVYIGEALSSLLERYDTLRLEEKSAVYRRIYDRWAAETRLLIQLGDSEIIGGNLAVWTTLDDFVGRGNSVNRGATTSARTVRDDLKLIKLHIPLPDLKTYSFQKTST